MIDTQNESDLTEDQTLINELGKILSDVFSDSGFILIRFDDRKDLNHCISNASYDDVIKTLYKTARIVEHIKAMSKPAGEA